MRAGLAALAFLVASDASAQAPKSAASPPVIACASLANLRAVLRQAKDDAAAAVPVVTDPKSDLGCSVLDQTTVTGLADHVALNGKAYDCLALRGTSICHWTVAGLVSPPPVTTAPSPREKPKRP